MPNIDDSKPLTAGLSQLASASSKELDIKDFTDEELQSIWQRFLDYFIDPVGL